MKLGSYEIPEVRLVPNCIEDIKKVYDTTKFEKISSKDLAKLLGYANATSGRFYVRLKSLITYGLLQSGNVVTQLGYNTAYPESPEHEDESRKKAIFNVGLWKELYKQIQKNPPSDFWVPLKNSARIDAPTAQKYASIIKKWYIEDIGILPEDVLDDAEEKDSSEETEGLTARSTHEKSVSQQLIQKVDPNSFGRLTVKGIGDIDLTDDDTITLAESALKILRKKMKKQDDVDSIHSQEATDFFNQENN